MSMYENSKRKISVIIPYRDRINNLKLVLQGLANQTMAYDQYEVIIGCLEYSEELARLVNEKYQALNIITIMTIEKWNTARARNIAMRQALGEVIVLLDADIVVPENFLELAWQEQNSAVEKKLILCQVKGYDEWEDGKDLMLNSFEEYKEKYLNKNIDEVALPQDQRVGIDFNIPWAMCWTGLVSFQRDVLYQHDLLFEENFTGWGAEDIEWGFRMLKAGLTIELSKSTWGIHLPHPREAKTIHEYEAKNFSTFINKWPCPEVEVVTKFGDFKGNLVFPKIKQDLLSYHPEAETLFSIAESIDGESKSICIGAIVKEDRIHNQSSFHKEQTRLQITAFKSLVGISLPYDSDTFEKAYISREVNELPCDLRQLILTEANRIATKLIN